MLNRSRLSPLRLPLLLSPRFPHRKPKSHPLVLKPKLRSTPTQYQRVLRVFRRVARPDTLTLPRQHLPCPPAAWSCHKPAPARSTRRPIRLQPNLPPAPGIWPPAFNAASRSSTVGPLRALALIPSAHRAVLQDSIRPVPARGPSILPAPLREVTPDQVALQLPAHALVIARGPALERPVQAALVAHPVLAVLRPPARRLVRSERRPAEAAAVARSTQRPKKAQ